MGLGLAAASALVGAHLVRGGVGLRVRVRVRVRVASHGPRLGDHLGVTLLGERHPALAVALLHLARRSGIQQS